MMCARAILPLGTGCTRGAAADLNIKCRYLNLQSKPFTVSRATFMAHDENDCALLAASPDAPMINHHQGGTPCHRPHAAMPRGAHVEACSDTQSIGDNGHARARPKMQSGFIRDEGELQGTLRLSLEVEASTSPAYARTSINEPTGIARSPCRAAAANSNASHKLRGIVRRRQTDFNDGPPAQGNPGGCASGQGSGTCRGRVRNEQ